MTFVSKILAEGDEFEVGDAWYNLTYGGKAYIFLRSKNSGGYAYFSFGKKDLFPKWAIIVIIVGSIVVFLGCIFICFCYVRRLYNKKNANKVQKFSAEKTREERLNKYKYNKGTNHNADHDFSKSYAPEYNEQYDEMDKYAQFKGEG
jgi:hypothetical protein